jgi:hypothetical protein
MLKIRCKIKCVWAACQQKLCPDKFIRTQFLLNICLSVIMQQVVNANSLQICNYPDILFREKMSGKIYPDTFMD